MTGMGTGRVGLTGGGIWEVPGARTGAGERAFCVSPGPGPGAPITSLGSISGVLLVGGPQASSPGPRAPASGSVSGLPVSCVSGWREGVFLRGCIVLRLGSLLGGTVPGSLTGCVTHGARKC